LNFSAPKEAPLRGRDVDLFDAEDYHTWIRQALALRGDPKLTALFDSTIEEPSAELTEIVRHAFWPSISSRYVNVFGKGNPYFLDALARRYDVPHDRLMLTTGATVGLGLALQALAGPGDHILVETPGFYLLRKLSAATGAEVSDLPRAAPAFAVDPDALDRLLRPNTKAVVLTNLHNPTGAYLEPAALQRLAKVAARVGAIVIVDEVYGDFARDAGATAAARLADNLVTVSSLTKVFGLFSLKAGWIAGAPEVLARIKATNPEAGYDISKLAHTVAALAMEEPEPFEANWKRILSANRPIVARHAERLLEAGLIEGAPPAHGCLYFPRLVGCDDSRPVCRALWRDDKVLVAPGEYFDMPGHIRVSYGLADSAVVETGMARLAAGLARRADISLA